MTLPHTYISRIITQTHQNLDTVEYNTHALAVGLAECYENIEALNKYIEEVTDYRLNQYAKNIYKMLTELKQISISEEEFMNILNE